MAKEKVPQDEERRLVTTALLVYSSYGLDTPGLSISSASISSVI
jgi:hypothetical protein